MGAHSFLPPSGANAWVHCAVWPTMNRLYPQDDTADTLVGEAAHWVLSERFAGRSPQEGDRAPNDERIDRDMVNHVSDVFGWFTSEFPVQQFEEAWTEQRLAIPSIHSICFGTPDRAQLAPTHIAILDFKYGHRFVHERENWQNLSYLRGVLDALIARGWTDFSRIRFSLAIAQPRAYDRRGSFRVWEIPAGSDLTHYWTALYNGAINALQENPRATTGDHCLDCPGRAKCPALRASGQNVVSVSGFAPPLDLTALEAAAELEQLRRAEAILKARTKGLEDELEAAYNRGERNFGYAMDRSLGRSAWTVPVEKAIQLGQLYGVDISRPGVATPLQAISAGIPSDVVKKYSERPLGEQKLVKVEQTLAYRAFF